MSGATTTTATTLTIRRHSGGDGVIVDIALRAARRISCRSSLSHIAAVVAAVAVAAVAVAAVVVDNRVGATLVVYRACALARSIARSIARCSLAHARASVN